MFFDTLLSLDHAQKYHYLISGVRHRFLIGNLDVPVNGLLLVPRHTQFTVFVCHSHPVHGVMAAVLSGFPIAFRRLAGASGDFIEFSQGARNIECARRCGYGFFLPEERLTRILGNADSVPATMGKPAHTVDITLICTNLHSMGSHIFAFLNTLSDIRRTPFGGYIQRLILYYTNLQHTSASMYSPCLHCIRRS